MQDLFSVKNKVVMLTGASSGIGLHFAEVLAFAGAKVALGARRNEKLEPVVKEIRAKGGQAISMHLDVTVDESIENMARGVESELGHIDVLINNAGVDIRKSFFESEKADWDSIFETNLSGILQVTKIVSPYLKKKKSSSIINLSSMVDALSFRGSNPAYTASKAGVSSLTRFLAVELANRGIRVNAIAPGIFPSEMTSALFDDADFKNKMESQIPLSRLGLLEDLNGALLFLASEASRYITGAVIRVDGGLSINKL